MHYTVYYACGHSGDVELFGKGKDREARLEWLATLDCPDCREKEHQAQTAKSAAAATELNFPALRGTPKQVAWAETIRMELYNGWMKELDWLKKRATGNAGAENIQQAQDVIDYTIINAVSASEWINNRNTSGREMLRQYRQRLDHMLPDASTEG